jgi:hypothetical protein
MIAKDETRTLIQEAVSMAIAKDLPLNTLMGVAFRDPGKDAPLISLHSFNVVKQAVTNIPNLMTRFGAEETTRIVLQFVYQYFDRVDSVRYDESAFETLWRDFTAEVEEGNWVDRGVANVRNFYSDSLLLELGDGITIRGRSPADLNALGFDDAVLTRIDEDWSGPGASSFVLVAEQAFPKQPDNLISPDSVAVWTKATRAVWALRLVGTGSMSIGPMWVIRAARFNMGMVGLLGIGASIPASGGPYAWTEKVSQAYTSAYSDLLQLEKDGYGKSPGNLEVALRAFMATYDRWPLFRDSQLLDSITTLEALLGADTEISFKLAFRVAGLLAENDAERGILFKLIKDFYDTRSKLVHGAQLKEKHRRHLGKVDELRSLVRQLLRVFVAYAISSPGGGYDKSFFKKRLDIALVDALEREKLRMALGLTKSSVSN